MSLPAEQRKQPLALLTRRDRVAGAADRQDAIRAVGVVEAVGQEASKIVVADRLAGGERAVAEDEERLAAANALDLTRQRLEERRRPHDRVADARLDEHLFESELGLLEREHGLLHADRQQQHDLRDTGLPRGLERENMGAVIDGPGIGRRAGA